MWKPIPQIMWAILFAILNGGPWTSWYSASAVVLPPELQGEYVMSTITTHFCEDGGGTYMPSEDGRYICCGSNDNQCSNETEHSMCMEDDQVYFCGYADAIVCQYKDGMGSCIYSNSSSIHPLCVCKDNGMWPTSDNQSSQIRGSCKGNETTTGLSDSYPGSPTATSSMSDQTTATSSMSDQTTATSSMSDQTTATNAPRRSGRGEVNIVAIVLGTILVIVLILLVVCLVKRRRNQTPPKKATTNPQNSSGVSTADRTQMPDPLVLGGTEYNYAYDHWPQSNPASDPGKPKPVNRYEENEPSGSSSITVGNSSGTQEVPKYYELGQPNDGRKGGETPQGPKYYELGQASIAMTGGKAPQAPRYDEVRRRPHTEQRNNEETPQDPNYFELEHLSDAVKGGKTPQAPKYDEVRRRPHTEQRNNEKTPQDPKYFELEHPQDNDNETVFREVDEAANPSPGGFSNQGYDQAYMLLQQTAKPAESGYESLKLPASAAERNDASSPYDHLNNKTGIRSQKVKLPEKEDGDQYASLNV